MKILCLLLIFIVDVGPGAGKAGGEIVFAGEVQDLIQCQNSVTGDYISGRKKIEIPFKEKRYKKMLY